LLGGPSITVEGGSATTSSNTLSCTPAVCKAFSTASVKPASRTPRSVTSITRRALKPETMSQIFPDAPASKTMFGQV
jgi:hypothetical protein